MLNNAIKKLSIILVLCGGIAILLYFTDIGDLFNGEVKKKVEKLKKEAEEKIEAKKEEIEKKVEKVEDKVESNIQKVEEKVESNVEKVEEKIEDLKKLKLRDLIK